jgi:hypothetical protein
MTTGNAKANLMALDQALQAYYKGVMNVDIACVESG